MRQELPKIFLCLFSELPIAFFSVVDPLHINAALRFFGTTAQAFVNPWSARLNVIANRCRGIILATLPPVVRALSLPPSFDEPATEPTCPDGEYEAHDPLYAHRAGEENRSGDH